MDPDWNQIGLDWIVGIVPGMHPELKQKDLLKIIGAMWQKTSKEERAPFEEKAKERKAQYQKDMAAFEAGPLAEFMKLQASKEEQSM